MPRGRPRKLQPRLIEVLPPEDDEVTKESPQNVIEVRHKTEWSEMRPAPDQPEPDEIFEDEKPRRRAPSERDELRKKLAKAAITPGSQLKLTIEKYSHSEAVDGQGGMFAEKEHCSKYACAEEHITSEDYLDVARRYGPGLYRFTLRMRNQIVTAWDKRISAGAPTLPLPPPLIQHNPNDPASPQVIYQIPEGLTAGFPGLAGQAPVGVLDQRKVFKDHLEMEKTLLEMEKLRREAWGLNGSGAPGAQSSDPKIAALSLIAENPDVMEKIGAGLAKTVLGSRGGGDSDPWADVAMEALRSGQAVQIVRAAIDSLFSGLNGLFPKPPANQYQNGQAVQQAPYPPNTPPPQAPQYQPEPGAGATGTGATGAGATNGGAESMIASSTEEQALGLVIDHCRRNAPVKVAFNRLINLADAIEELMPQGSIYDYVELFGKMSIDSALEFVEGLPGGKQVTGLQHCRQWTAELQKMILESQGDAND